METYDENPLVTVTAGSLRIDVWYCEDRRDDDGGTRRAYGYRLDDHDPVHKPYEATDLESGVGAEIDVHGALQTLVSFLSAAADGYRYTMAHPGSDPESLRLFPLWVGESAYMNDTELSVLTDGPDPDHQLERAERTAAADPHPLPVDAPLTPRADRPDRPGLSL